MESRKSYPEKDPRDKVQKGDLSKVELPKTFYFVRHGETDWNLENKFQGQNDIPLNSTGKDQAVAAARILKTINIGVIFCSNLLRAKETAEIFATSFSLKPRFEIVPELGECSSEITARLIFSELGLTSFPSFSEVSDASETPALFVQRIDRGLRRIFQNRGEDTPLVVAHGGTYWAICQILNIAPIDIPNCLPIRFEREGSNWNQKAIWV